MHCEMPTLEKFDEIKTEIISSIKEKINEIIGDELYKPIVLKNLSVIDNTVKYAGPVNCLYLQNLYIDDNNKLCGDFLNRDNYFSNEFVFGRSIENLYTEDLIKILEKLNKDYFAIKLHDNLDEQNVYTEKKSILKSLVSFKSLFNTQMKTE